jgi:hypothetical protein
MNAQNIYQFISSTIVNSETRSFGCVGRYVRILTWGSTTPLQISFDGATFKSIAAGMAIKLPDTDEPFTMVYVLNNTGSDVLLEMGISTGEIIDSRFTSSGTITTKTPGVVSANGYDVLPIAAAATIIAATFTARRSISIRALTGNVDVIYLGFSNLVTASKYFIALQPGEVYSIDDYAGAIYGFAAHATDSVSYGEV